MSHKQVNPAPYLQRAIYEWCLASGFTPHVAFIATPEMGVPMQYVKDNAVALNVLPSAVNNLTWGDDYLAFEARFNGQAHHIVIPVTHILKVFAKETGEGLDFIPDLQDTQPTATQSPSTDQPHPGENPSTTKPRPKLTLVKG